MTANQDLNCLFLNFTKTVDGRGLTYIEALVNSLGAGLGFMLAMVIFAGVRSRVEQSDAPEALKGLPITLIAASIVSVGFLGFAGLGA